MREYTIINTENNKASPLKTIAERIYTKNMSAGCPALIPVKKTITQLESETHTH